MKKLTYLLTLAVSLALCLAASPAWAKYSGGSGTAEDPYQIATAADMNAIGADSGDWDKHFKLTADIDLSGYTGETFNMIGVYQRSTETYIPFTGVFNGDGHTISNFTYTSTEEDEDLIFRDGEWVTVYWTCFTAIFKYTENAEIKNLALIDPNVVSLGENNLASSLVGFMKGTSVVTNCYVQGGSVTSILGDAGGLIGWNYYGTISNCYATCNVTTYWRGGGLALGSLRGTITDCYATGDLAGWSRIGGLVGVNELELGSGRIADCYATGNVSGNSDVGGLVGENRAIISNSYATGNVSGTEETYGGVGGLVGVNDGWSDPAEIHNCYALGNVSANNGGGGLVGENVSGGLISKSYSAGSVSGTTNTGGLVGSNPSSTVTASFWDKETSGRTTSAGGTGLMTADMQTRSTFTDAGWDFTNESANGSEDIWRLCVDLTDYPRFVWQKRLLGDFYCPDGSDFKDYAVPAGQWQQAPGEPSADIVPFGGDGIVDGLDLKVLCENWLAE